MAAEYRRIETHNKNQALGLYVDGSWVGTVFENVHGVSWARLTEGFGVIEGADELASLNDAKAALERAVAAQAEAA